MNSPCEDTVDYAPTIVPPSGGADASSVKAEAIHLRLRALARTCPLIEHAEEQDGILTLHLSAAGLSHLENTQTEDEERQPAHDLFAAASQCGFMGIVLDFPPNVNGLRTYTAELIASLHRKLRKDSAKTTITLRGPLPQMFIDRLRIHRFDQFVTIEEGAGQTESAAH
ncbi:MAG: hypothetical protein PHX87_01535 [Candidatus Peribacteraceae bacterium]|nr:hypothetical protein [Candidatus Peribacteraceae bacterium]MDD5742089.1 hypothetical protein [Candidatus Peribacteraceae bacterium]